MTDPRLDLVKRSFVDVPDFPKPGIVFKDVTPLLADAEAFGACIDLFAERAADAAFDVIVGIESRGFRVAAPLAYAIGSGFAMVRKKGKLPGKTVRYSYDLEYGTDALEIHADACTAEARVLIVDDVLATGGTADATRRLVE